MNEILVTIGSIIGTLGGWKAIEYLINRKSNKQIAEANAFEVQRKAILEDYERVQKEVDVLKKKVDELYEKLHSLENERLDLIRENNELRLQIKDAERHVCLQPDDRCLQRLNPNVKCRLVGLLRGDYSKDHPDAIITEDDMQRKEKENEETAQK